MKSISKLSIFLFSFILFLTQVTTTQSTYAANNSNIDPMEVIINEPFVMNIGDEEYMFEDSYLNGFITFTSSKPSIASIDKTGKTIAKKAGTTTVTASCLYHKLSIQVKVVETTINLNTTSITLDSSSTYQLKAVTSTGSSPKFKCNDKNIASIDENGLITAHNAGTTTITVTCDQTKVTCSITVKSPTIKLCQTTINMYQNQTTQISANVSNGTTPTYKSSKKRVATISDDGLIIAKKHGQTIITASVDGVSTTCIVNVLSPTISIPNTSYTLIVGESHILTPKVSSGNKPSFKSSNKKIVKVSKSGEITAQNPGTAYITISQDGTQIKCKVTVVDVTVTP